MQKKQRKSNSKKTAFPLGIRIGISILVIGCIILIISFIINRMMYYNPYIEPKTDFPQTIADTFVVPEGSKYNRAYHIYTYKNKGTLTSYSKKMFQAHKLSAKNVKMEGGYVYKFNNKTIFSVYIYNLDNENVLNLNLDIKFTNYNGTEADNIVYKIENLQPLESKNIEIEVDSKTINAYDYIIE